MHTGPRGKTITVFGSGSECLSAEDYEQARQLGAELARRGFTVCNGGYGGTMEAAARGAREHGEGAVGVTLEEPGNRYLARELPQPDLPARILCLLERGAGYVVLAGGTGTLAEIGMLLEFRNKGLLPVRPVVFLGPFWGPLLELLAGEKMFREPAPFRPVEGIEMHGAIARTDSTAAAAEYLAANL